jgi:hypothetical protein
LVHKECGYQIKVIIKKCRFARFGNEPFTWWQCFKSDWGNAWAINNWIISVRKRQIYCFSIRWCMVIHKKFLNLYIW